MLKRILQSSKKENKLSSKLYQKRELHNLIDITAEYLEKHNAVVTRLWEIQHQIAKHRADLLNNPDYLNDDEFKSNLKSLNNRAKMFINKLAKNHSTEMIDENLRKIEALYNEVYPENTINF